MTTAGQDWRDLPAGGALDRIVAERLGWRIAPGVFAGLYSSIFTPGGSQTGAMKTGANFGDYCVVQGQGWPRYSRAATAALGLLANYHWTMHGTYDAFEHKEIYRCAIDGKPGDGVIMPSMSSEQADTLALAICRAWLAYQERTRT